MTLSSTCRVHSVQRRILLVTTAAVLFCSAVPLRADRFTLLSPGRPSGKLARALEMIARGELRGADALLGEVIDKEPGQVYAALAQVQIAVTQRRLAVAAKSVDTILAREPARPEAHNMKGVVALLQNRTDDAHAAFSRALSLRPGYVTPAVYLAGIERSRGRYEQAVGAYQRLIAVAPRLPAGYLGAAEAQIMMMKATDAFATLASWKRADPRSALPPQVIANVHLSRGESAQAVAELTSALTTHPRSPALLTGLGTAYAIAGDARGAAAQFTAALAADQRHVDALLGLGDLEAKAGAPDRALVQYRRALALRPDYPVACNNVAWVLAERGSELGEALRLATRAAQFDPTYVDAQDTLGWVHYRRGEYRAAVTALEQAKATAPSRADIAAHLGLAYAKAGRGAEAQKELARALTARPPLPQRAELERTLNEVSASRASRPK